MEVQESCVKLRLQAGRPSTAGFRCAALPFFPLSSSWVCRTLWGPVSGLSQTPITECTASPIGLTRRSHGSGISDELKVITCDKPLSGRMCSMLVEGGVGGWLTLVTFLTRNRRVMTSSSADMDRNSTSMGPYCCRPGSGQYCTHGCSQREEKREEADSQEKLITQSWAV